MRRGGSRRHITVRGRVTIVSLVGVLATLTLWGWRAASRDPGWVSSGAALPEVAAAPPAQGTRAAAVPESLYRRVPTGPEMRAAMSGTGVVEVPSPDPALGDSVHLRTTFDPELTQHVWKVLERGRVELGHVVVLDPHSSRLLAYASTDPDRFPPTRLYPAASLVKVITAAAALDREPGVADETCHYEGNPYRLSPRRIDPPRRGRTISVRRALAQSNNQCFAQLAVHRIGRSALLDAIDRFGFLAPPAPGHAAGSADDPGSDRYALGKLGSGLAGTQITPLHAAQLGGVIATGWLREPRWLDEAWDGSGNRLAIPAGAEPRQVLTEGLTRELRDMLVDTTRRGTARKAFRTRRGHPLLQEVRVAGKTGSLSGRDPDGRYEWFVGAAPADAPRVVVATVVVQTDLYWQTASQIAAEVMKGVFCPKGVCRAEAAERFASGPAGADEELPQGG